MRDDTPQIESEERRVYYFCPRDATWSRPPRREVVHASMERRVEIQEMDKGASSNKRCFSEAYTWLKAKRRHYPPSSDIWDFRRSWKTGSATVIKSFLTGSYRFDVQKKVQLASGESIALWSSADALVLKVLAFLIQDILTPFFSRNCYHLKGHGGLKRTVGEVMRSYPRYGFFIKTDVRSYYDSIDHHKLMMKLSEHVGDRKMLRYVWLFLRRTVEWGGLHQDVKRGISRGSALSPLLGAFYLLDLDRRIEKMDVKYFRYMDDILILAKTRWKLKKAIRVLNETFHELKLEKHPDKTAIGRTEKGFDFLGYHFGPEGLSVAEMTIERFFARAVRLYEQGPGEPGRFLRLGSYVRHWERWAKGVTSGDVGLPFELPEDCYNKC